MSTDNTSTQYWNTIYQSKNENEVSWYQEYPATSINLILKLKLPLSAPIIDIGGGESHLVDALLDLGYTNISVLDISEKALEKSKNRLGEKSKLVKWIVTDVTEFKPTEKYDLWHDRAAFHFLITEEHIETYISIAKKTINLNGFLIIGTFSENGPVKCSGLDIKQYTNESLNDKFGNSFNQIYFQYSDHSTPFGTTQNFLFCTFKNEAT